MRVVYVSKALRVAAYREKIREMARLVEIEPVIPERWGSDTPEASPPGLPEPRRVPVRLHGHNHLHVYRRPTRWLADGDGSGPHLVHVDEEPYSLATAQLALACRRLGAPFVFFAWQNLARRLPPPFGVLRSGVYRAAAGGIAGTDGALRVLRDSGFDGPTTVVPQFGVDPARFAPDPEARQRVRNRLAVPEAAFVVGYAGRLVPEKGVSVLLEAFARLRVGEGAAEPHLLVIGDGPERPRLEADAVTTGVAGRARFTGRRPSLEMPGLLAALDVLVLPTVGSATWTEQFGRVLVEAMACGIPVVGTRCGEIPAVVGEGGEVVPPGDAGALRAALERLRDGPCAARDLGARGRERVLRRFTQERVARDTVAFYEAVSGRRPARSGVL